LDVIQETSDEPAVGEEVDLAVVGEEVGVAIVVGEEVGPAVVVGDARLSFRQIKIIASSSMASRYVEPLLVSALAVLSPCWSRKYGPR
jgi:hypothetical protein